MGFTCHKICGGWGLLALAMAAIVWGGTKPQVIYPRTDPNTAWLVDRGSWVSNDVVHIDFFRIVAPASANLYIDRRPVGSTNDADWVELVATTFAAFDLPHDLSIPAATNYDYAVYTDWTPGPTVVTNGVWHANWANDRARLHILPIRTLIDIDGHVIAPPNRKVEIK